LVLLWNLRLHHNLNHYLDRVRMKRSPLRKVSKKRSKELREYSKLRKEFLKRRPYCEIFEACCTRIATTIHHMNHRENLRLLDKSWWLPACLPCHRFITDQPAYARANGFTI